MWNQSGRQWGWEDLNKLSAAAKPLVSFINPDAQEFLAPENMPETIRAFCARAGQPVPTDEGSILRCALDSIAMKIVAKDASCLVFSDHDLTYLTNTAEIGPGESRDAIFTAPAYSGGAGTSGQGYDVYRLYDRNFAYGSNAGGAGYGGQMTEVRIYPSSFNLPAQTKPNE